MINKRSIWFLTLFCLILVLSVYYVTMPSELLLSTNSNYVSKETTEGTQTPTVEVTESTILTSLRVESDEQMMNEIQNLQTILTNKDSTVDEKNNAYEKIKQLNLNKGEEQQIEKQISDTYKLKSFVKVNGDQVRVVVLSKEHDSYENSAK